MSRQVDIAGVIDLLDLEIQPRTSSRATQIRVNCPFCEDTHYSMGVHLGDNVYQCFRCGVHGGFLDLYARLRLHRELRGDGKEVFRKLKDELQGTSVAPRNTLSNQPRERKAPEPRTDDTTVHQTYRALLELPVFALRDEDKDNLVARGLDDASIIANGYRSFYGDKPTVDALITPEISNTYEAAMRQALQKDTFAKWSLKRVLMGVAIADMLLQQGCKLRGVPGFFVIDHTWCFVVDDGMYIPTRNHYGEIVALQVRKPTGALRYKTVSSSSYPYGVNEHVVRAHFPRNNTPIVSSDTYVYITEGPLKADVASHLLEWPDSMFIALHGVNSVIELPEIMQWLHDNGVTRIYNAFDVDQCVNPNVLRAANKITKIAAAADIHVTRLFWDANEAARLRDQANAYLREHGLSAVVPTEQPHLDLIQCVACLKRNGLAPGDAGLTWDHQSKGIDDWLKQCKAKT